MDFEEQIKKINQCAKKLLEENTEEVYLEGQKEIDRLFKEDIMQIEKREERARAIEKADTLFSEGKTEEAKEEIQKVLLFLAETHLDSLENIYSFDNEFSFELTKVKTKSNFILYIDEAISIYYHTYAEFLFTCGDTSQALIYLEKARRFNPCSFEIMVDLALLYLGEKNMIRFYDTIREALFYAYKDVDLANGYYNIALYAFFQKDKKLIHAALSASYNACITTESKELLTDLFKGKAMSLKETQKILEKNNILFGPNSFILDYLYQFGMEGFTNKDYEKARYYLELLYGLTDDSAINDILVEIKEKTGDIDEVR